MFSFPDAPAGQDEPPSQAIKDVTKGCELILKTLASMDDQGDVDALLAGSVALLIEGGPTSNITKVALLEVEKYRVLENFKD